MNKSELEKYMSTKYSITAKEAGEIIETFTSSIMSALGEGKDVQLLGFGSFSVSEVAARKGRNPRTGAEIDIAAYKQPRFKVGQKMKDAVNS